MMVFHFGHSVAQSKDACLALRWQHPRHQLVFPHGSGVSSCLSFLTGQFSSIADPALPTAEHLGRLTVEGQRESILVGVVWLREARTLHAH